MSKAAPPEATVRRFEDDANTLQALISGQADIIGAAATQVANLEKAAGPGKFEQKFVLIPTLADQNSCAQSRNPMDIMVHGCFTSLFQA